MARSRRPGGTAGSLIRDYLSTQHQAFAAGTAALRGGSEAVHATRVATRRIRSTVRVFARFVDADRARRLDAELGWFASLLGDLRDADVQRDRLLGSLDAVPPDAVAGPVRARIETFLGTETDRGRTALDAAMSTPRYAALVRECAAWAADPPLSQPARKKASAVQKTVVRASRKVRSTLAEAVATGDDEQLHRARKQSKRARYAAELAAPALGRRSRKRIRRLERLQKVLGEHQDAVVAADLLRRIADGVAALPQESGFTFGVLHERERRRARRSRRAAISAARKL